MEKVKNPFATVQNVVMLALCVILAGSFSFCTKKIESGDDDYCPDCPCGHFDAPLDDIAYYAYINNELRYYEVVDNKVTLWNYDSSVDSSQIKNTLRTMGVKTRKVTTLGMDVCMLVEMENIPSQQVICLVERWKMLENDIYLSPVLSYKNHAHGSFVPNQFLVQLKQKNDYDLLLQALESYNVKAIELAGEYLPWLYLVTINDANRENSMQIAKELHETGLFIYAEPRVLQFVVRLYK